MKFSLPNRLSDCGQITFAVLMLCASITFCTTMMLAISGIEFRIEVNRGLYEVAYAAAKGVAVVELNQLTKGKIPITESVRIGEVLVHTHITGRQVIGVQVSAAYKEAVDTISFTYDTISKKLTDWQDNGPEELQASP